MANIKDVAIVAGVSSATVSHVINGTRFVSPETTKRVCTALERMHYTPNSIAKGLRTNKTKTIAVIVNNISNGFFGNVVEAIGNVLQEDGYNLFLCNSKNDPNLELQYLRAMNAQLVSGIILGPLRMEFDYSTVLSMSNNPLVFIDRAPFPQNGDAVVADNFDITYQAITELIARGHSKIACLRGDVMISTTQDRTKGYEKALRDHGLEVNAALIKQGEPNVQNGYQMMQEIIDDGRTTAVFAADNLITQGALYCLHENQIPIPEKMALLGFDEFSWSAITNPPLSTIRQPMQEMGKIAAELLLKRIAKPGEPYQKIVLQSKLVLRKSI